MDNLISMASDINELVNTIEEGLKHIQTRARDGYFEDTLYLFEDIVEGLNSIFEALQSIDASRNLNRAQNKTVNLLDALDAINLAYRETNTADADLLINNKLMPAFAEWKAELEGCLFPIIQS